VEVEIVPRLTKEHRRELFEFDRDMFHVGRSLDDFPVKRFEQYMIGRVSGALIGVHGMLRHEAVINGVRRAIAGVGAFFINPAWRTQGHGHELHRLTMVYLRDVWRVCGALAFCQPPLVPYYRMIGALEVTCPVLIERADGALVPSPQRLVWWPYEDAVRDVQSLDVESRRW